MGLLGRPRSAPPTGPKPKPAFTSQWKTEQEWLVDFIVRDLAGIATYAATGRAPRPADLKLEVSQTSPSVVHVSASLALEPGKTPRTVQEDVRLEPHLWAPEPYLGIAHAFLATQGSPSAPPDPKDSERVLEALLDLRTSTLLRENHAISDRLKASPLDATAHEDAALLLAAFGLREGSGWFYDNRTGLSRVTAHLVMSRFLRGPSEAGLTGRYVEAVVASQVEREVDALARLSELERGAGGSAAQAAWIRTLRLRNTGDWRLTSGQKRLTLAEKREEFCAMARALDTDAAVEMLDRRGADPVPDWGRVLMGWGASVETAQRFGTMLPAQELQEIEDGWRSLRSDPPPEGKSLVDALNETPGGLVSADAGGGPVVSVLDWGAWAAFEQRHLLHAIDKYFETLDYLLGLKDDAKAFAKSSREQFGGLTLYPVELVPQAKDLAAYKTAVAGFFDMARQSPERVPGGCWYRIRIKPKFEAPHAGPPFEERWFQPSLVSGTLYELPFRLRLHDLDKSSAAERKRLREMAPFHYGLTKFDLTRSGGTERPLAELAAAFGSTAEYDTHVMDLLAYAARDNLPEYERQQGKLCRLIPESCLTLGWRLAENGQDEKAAAAYQDGIDRARDAVSAANNSRWLVDYYFDHGQKARALKVAESAAETYSSRGLFAMARLMERMGRLDDAELYYGRMSQRYEEKEQLLGFFYRQSSVLKNRQFDRRLEKMMPEVFPKGLEKLDRAKLPATPTDGVVVQGSSERTKKYELPYGAVVVALDGFRVHTLKEYDAVLALSQAAEMNLVVWRAVSYDDIRASLWDRSFYAELKDYKPPRAK
jgi:hypothetical protein